MQIDPLKLAPVTGKTASESLSSLSKSDSSFANLFNNALEEVNNLQQDASNAGIKLAAGKIQDVSEVVIATEKATIALQLTMQVRNKVVEAYQEVMRMQV
jgi:flagellar hook-basal body complex protein FliE